MLLCNHVTRCKRARDRRSLVTSLKNQHSGGFKLLPVPIQTTEFNITKNVYMCKRKDIT